VVKYKVLSENDMDLLYLEFLYNHINNKEQIRSINQSLEYLKDWEGDDLYYATRDAYMETLVLFGDVRKDLFNNYIIVKD